MKNSSSQSFSGLEVNDFGPIARAKVELRPMTVFVGPSNTGKSYLAILLYALHRFFSGIGIFGYPFSFYIQNNKVQKLSKENSNALLRWAKEIFSEDIEPPNISSIALDPVSGLIRSAFARSDEEIGHALVKEIGRCFGIGNETGKLVRKENRNGLRLVFRKPVSNNSKSFVRNEFTASARGNYEFNMAIPEQMSMRLGPVSRRDFGSIRHMAMDLVSSAGKKSERRKYEPWELISALASSQLHNIIGPLNFPAFYLPADRTGVMHAHNVVVSALIQHAPMAGLRTAASTPTLSGVLADFLGQLIALGNQPYRMRRLQDNLGERIEKHVLRGSVHTDESESGYPSFTFQPQGWKAKLPLMNASSMVSELAPVVLYLRHIVLPGNVLIVEEPESHLHPAMQVEFTRQLAAVVNSGVRVIITTHSEWLLEELANLVHLSRLSKAARKKIDGDDVALSPDQVGAWLFEPKSRPKGSVVKEIPLDEESGLFPSGFSDVAVALHNKWADIRSEIEGKG